ncbi:MAG: hypothetical protein E7434_04560 [Ruminococcaceae bacterium]|nr:hypothetical protein [Oscillospiraceae bacterium]
MFRFLRRKLVQCIFLIAIFFALKKFVPEIGKAIGEWIGGTRDSGVAAAFSEMYDAFNNGEGAKKAMEVFCDGLFNAQTD